MKDQTVLKTFKLRHTIRTAQKTFLFYANKTPKDTAYIEEVEAAKKAKTIFRLIASMTDIEGYKDWKGETGYFTKEMLQKYLDNLSLPIYLISGPASMVTSIQKTLNGEGIDDDDNRTEEFSGY